MKPHIKKVQGEWLCIGRGVTCHSSNVHEAWAGWAGVPVDRPYRPKSLTVRSKRAWVDII